MIWVTWRQHRTQAAICAGLLCAIAIFAVAVGVWMRSTFSSDGLGACLASSGGAGCPAAISSFTREFNGGATLPLTLALFVIPGFLGAVIGAPLLGAELERGTWRLAWSQTVPRTRWLVTKLALVTGGLVVFGAAVTLVVTWSRAPLDRLSIRLQPPPFNFEGLQLTCSLLCAFGLAVLAGLLLRNTIGAMVAGYFAWEVPFLVVTLLNGPLHVLTATARVPCAAGCPTASTNSVPPVTGNLGDLVLDVTRSGNHLVVDYLPASRFWTMQLIEGGMYLAIAVAALGSAVWLLHRRTT
jgi:ABC-type transport system involved in multi-copper enzyme maturation permease subunit